MTDVDYSNELQLAASYDAIARRLAQANADMTGLTQRALKQRITILFDDIPALEEVVFRQRTSDYNDEGPEDWSLTVARLTIGGTVYAIAEDVDDDDVVYPDATSEPKVTLAAEAAARAVAPFPNQAVSAFAGFEDFELRTTREGLEFNCWEWW